MENIVSKENRHDIAYVRYAFDYLSAAKLVQDASASEVSWPAYYLLMLGIELSFKAFLISAGCGEELLRAVDHILKRAVDESQKRGIGEIYQFSDEFLCTLAMLEQLNRRHALRYVAYGHKRVPSWKPTLEMAADLFNAVASHVGAKERMAI